MSETDPNRLDGLKALVTGGASGIGHATARLLAARGADVAVLDLDPAGARAPLLGVKADVSDDASVREGVAAAVDRLGRPRHPGQQRGRRRRRHGRGQRRRAVAPRPGRQRPRHGPHLPCRAAAPAAVRARRDRQHLLDRRDRRAAAARALQRQQGGGAVPDPRHGRRPRTGRGTRQLREPGHGRHPLGRPPPGRRRRPGGRTRRPQCPSAHGPPGQCRGSGRRHRLPGEPRRGLRHRTGASRSTGGMQGLRLRPAEPADRAAR